MKRVLLLLCAASMLLLLSGCGGHRHTWIPATCTASKICSECGKFEGPPLGHDWGEVEYIPNADYTEVTAKRVCKRDSTHIETETVKTRDKTVLTEADCDVPGEIQYSVVFEDGYFPDTVVIEERPALGHYWGEPKYEWSEDYQSIVALRVCRRNSEHIETETAPVSRETLVEPGCETAGRAMCSVSFENPGFEVPDFEDELAPLGHDWGETVYTWSEDHSSVTATHVCLRDSEHTESETVTATREIDPASGETAWVAAFDGEFEPVRYGAQPLMMMPDAAPEDVPEPTPEATPEPTPEATPEPTPEATPEPTPKAEEAGGDDGRGHVSTPGYFKMSFQRFCSKFKAKTLHGMKIVEDGEGGYELSVKSSYLNTFRLTAPVRVYVEDSNAGTPGTLDEEGRFNSLRFVIRDESGVYHESLAKLMTFFICKAGEVLDSKMPSWQFVNLFRAERIDGAQELECECGDYVIGYICTEDGSVWEYECSLRVK